MRVDLVLTCNHLSNAYCHSTLDPNGVEFSIKRQLPIPAPPFVVMVK